MRDSSASRAARPFVSVVSVVIACLGYGGALWAQAPVSAAAVFKSAAPSVGRLVLLDAKGGVAASASSFVVGANGLVATNYHCLVDREDGWVAHTARVELPGLPPYTAEGVVAFDEKKDWAILKVPASGLPAIRLGDASKMEKGEPVVAVGYPVGLDARPTSGTFSGWLEDEILHDASTSSGNSGGPLLDREGRAIGITRGELRSTTGMVTLNDLFFAVDVKHILPALSPRTAALTRLPLVSPDGVKAAASKQAPASIRVGEEGGGPGGAIVLGVLGVGAVAGGTWLLIDKATDAPELADPSPEIARFGGTVAACSHQAHQFQLTATANVHVEVRSLSPGSSTLDAYGFLGACGGQATFTNLDRGQPGCGVLSSLTQLGGCTPIQGGFSSVILNNFPPGTHTIAVHNHGSAAASYEVILEKI